MTQYKANDINHFDEMIPENTQLQLLPAFYDLKSNAIFLSRFANGDLAPVHTHDGLPGAILARKELKLVSGFIYNGQFLTHEQATERLSDLHYP